MANLRAPRGTQDIFGEQMKTWKKIEKVAREICETYNVTEMKTPIFEHTEVFDRGNDASDVVNKEMYTFKDRGDRSLTLKPEGTAGVVRAFVENKLFAQGTATQKYFYISPNFRYERPQKGRMRMHTQFGVEYFGNANPYTDVEAILLGLKVLNTLGLTKYKLVVNTLGDKKSQDTYKEALIKHFEPYIDELGEDNKRRFTQNPLRILDDKYYQDHEALKTAPDNKGFMNEKSKAYFEEVLSILDANEIEYEVDEKLVRGLDYYHHTVFEVISTDEKAGAQSTIFAGGRYDHLVEYFGGPEVSAFGFGMGIERLMLYLETAGIDIKDEDTLDVYGMPLDKESNTLVFKALNTLRNANFKCDADYENRSMRAQFKMVDRLNAKVAMLVGEDEVKNNEVTIKHIETQEQVTVALDDLTEQIKTWLGEK
ncbi:MAG TPA: histidine--tRNA ligase [Erysipelothrix sp.]|nr:histidine--tRNA ligase [Erysipelothrix sp.]